MKTSFPKQRSQGPTSSVGEVLDDLHLSVFTRAVSSILSTDNAQFTLAQLVDGLPVADVAAISVGRLHKDHPIVAHKELCNGALARTRAWLAEFNHSTLSIETWLLKAFQSASPNTRPFNLRLLEMAAVAIHQIAVSIFNLEEKAHDGDIANVMFWQEPLRTRTWEDHMGRMRVEEIPRPPVYPTMFLNHHYLDHEQYPSGVADIAGYWAEDWIFGGVVLFDRGEFDDDSKDVYLHSGRKGVTKRVWRPHGVQQASVFEFLTSDSTEKVSGPLPLSCDRTHVVRHDAWDAMALHHIYRDPWERKETPQKDYEREYSRKDALDYPEMEPGTSIISS